MGEGGGVAGGEGDRGREAMRWVVCWGENAQTGVNGESCIAVKCEGGGGHSRQDKSREFGFKEGFELAMLHTQEPARERGSASYLYPTPGSIPMPLPSA